MYNFSYNCGSARQFLSSSGNLYDNHIMNCQWDKNWNASHVLDECKWVACLKPPIPPGYANLVNTDWNGEPIAFGDKTHFVCRRSYKYVLFLTKIKNLYCILWHKYKTNPTIF